MYSENPELEVLLPKFIPIVKTLPADPVPGGHSLSGEIIETGGSNVFESGIILYSSFSQHDPTYVRAEQHGDLDRFSVVVNNLESGSDYFYRAYSINEIGESRGAIKRFSTPEENNWYDSYSEFDGGWRASDWFGTFLPFENDWIYHQELGWVFVASDEKDGLWLWHELHGWLWTKEGVWPFLFCNDTSNWLYFVKNFQGIPYFYDYGMNNYYHFDEGSPIDYKTAGEHIHMNTKTTSGSVFPGQKEMNMER